MQKFTRIELPLVEKALGNGLRVIVNEDHSAPIVAVHVMYRAGSRDEIPGRTGLAHLLEHLLFEGSANCPKGEFDLLLEEVGGSNNGSTWLDRTNYYEVVPSHAVELALWLERERMGYFLPVLDEEMLEVQRSVVINERKQVYENRPYGLAHEKLHEQLFPQRHPYSWPTIGYTPDLEAITLDDARQFYRRFYDPSNGVLVICGDVKPEQAFGWAEKYFGDLGGETREALPDRSAPVPLDAPDPAPQTLHDRVSFPRSYQAWAVPGYGTREWIALDILSYLLADGESSRLQKELIRERQIAQHADTYLYPTHLAGIFGVVATARSGHSNAELTEAIGKVLRSVREDGVTEKEVTGAIRRARRDHLNGMSNLEGRADDLAYAATVLGDPERFAGMLNEYPTVTAEEIQEAAVRYLREDAAATVLVEPKEEARDAA